MLKGLKNFERSKLQVKKIKYWDCPVCIGLGSSIIKPSLKPKMSDFSKPPAPAVLQPLELEVCTVSHLKVLILEQFIFAN